MSKRVIDITKGKYAHLYLSFQEKYYDNLVLYTMHNSRYCPTWQQLEVMEEMQKPGCRVSISSGHGCLAKGHLLRLYDNKIIPVEDVRIGNVLVGPDGMKRTVHKLCYGVGKLLAVFFSNGDSHIYNDQHNLALKSDEGIHRVPIQDYINNHDDYKDFYCLKNGNRVDIASVYPIDDGEYFGFELVEDSTFIDADGYFLENTGKSFLAGFLLDWHLRTFPFSNSLLTATNIDQVRSVVWKYIDEAIVGVEKNYPWMKGFFIKQAKAYYAKGYKDSWYVLPKTASKDKPENLAGQHNFNYLVYADEASGIPDENIGVIRGALTEKRNRLIMSSQPTRPSGHFAESQSTLAKKKMPDGSVKGIYECFILNSEESPLVSRQFIREKLIEYGGHSSPMYAIRVLGILPTNIAGFLIPRHWCEDCQYFRITHEEPWGWVMTVDVAEGLHRDSSVLTVGRVSGYGPDRKVEVVTCDEYLDLDEKQFARVVAAKYRSLSGATIAVDADGAGRTVVLELDEMGIPCDRIHWGLPPHSKADQKRYLNLRAYAQYQLREGILEERFKGPVNPKFVEQASKLPYKIDEAGRYRMMPKDQMRSEGIKSPDISDTCSFFYLVDYIPCDGVGGIADENERDMLDMAKAILEAGA